MDRPIYSPEYGVFPPQIPGKTDIPLTKTDIPDGADCVLCGGYLYCIGFADNGYFSIWRVDGGAADHPVYVGGLTGLGSARQIEVEGDLAVVTTRAFGLYIINIHDRTAPKIVSHYNTVELATGVAISGKYVYIGCRTFGIEIIDVSDPDNPRHTTNLRAGEVQSIFVDGHYLYAGAWGQRTVTIFDVSDVLSPKQLAVVPLGGQGDGLDVKDGYCYAAYGQNRRGAKSKEIADPCFGTGNGFQIIDVHDPAHPVTVSETYFDYKFYYCGFDNWDVAVSGHYAVLSHTFNGVFIYDITDKARPVLVNHIAVEQPMERSVIRLNSDLCRKCPPVFAFDPDKVRYAPVTGAAVAEGRLYFSAAGENFLIARSEEYFHGPTANSADRPVCDFYDRYPGDRTEGVLIRRTAGQTASLAMIGGNIWAACGNDGLRVFEPERLDCIAHLPTGDVVTGLAAAGDLLYAADGMEGLVIYRVDGLRTEKIGQMKLPYHTISQVAVSANRKHAILHGDDRFIMAANVADPTHPFLEIQEFNEPGLVYYRHISESGVDGRYFAGFWNSNITRWYDFGGDEAVFTGWEQGKVGFSCGVTGLDDYKAIVTQGGYYVVCDIREKKLYSEYEHISLPGVRMVGKPAVKGNVLVLSDRLDGDVNVLDIADPMKPKLLGSYNFSGHPDVALIEENAVYVPLGHQGIAKIDL